MKKRLALSITLGSLVMTLFALAPAHAASGMMRKITGYGLMRDNSLHRPSDTSPDEAQDVDDGYKDTEHACDDEARRDF